MLATAYSLQPEPQQQVFPMTSMQRVWSAVLGCLCLAACGSADEPRPPPPVEETVFADVAVTPLEKAKNVQNVVDEQKRATDAAVQRSESDE
jgi:hypothetical protein